MVHDQGQARLSKCPEFCKLRELLGAGRHAELDLEHLLEELDDMSESERRELQLRQQPS
ncbi:MAG TPA: hypothetical protein DDY14_17915 [Chromatiaceae bacterium]|nr:MAG: DUF29 family protein [Thiohalocapsa sp. PB-PSB1]HBG97155.1 hypothetical protein [Chromatiaceae bacterium]HCS90200.1 hypothetical protein [Chromatiaceae bacterium]